jgi:2-methylcitrate dehydratase PrpD
MDQAVSRDRTRELADCVVGFGPRDLSAEDLAQLDGLILDHLGVALRGASLPWGVALAKWAAPYDGTGRCVVFGTGLKVTAPVAGMANASAAHGMELDDTHDESITHPGAVVIATALAVGTERRASGGDVLAAIVAGYEVMARVGAATGAADILERGFHPTALFGGFGAAAVAAKLMGLDANQLCEAWGLMLSMAGGSMQFSQDPHGTVVKRLHGGYGAHNGTIAAQLAAGGLAGPAQAFDGIYGLCRNFGSEPDLTRLERGPDDAFEIHRISYKPYPCCRLFHSTIDALREVTGGFTLEHDQIETITVGGPAGLATQHMMTRPASMMAAQYSLPYTLGASLVAGPHDYEVFAEDRLGDTAILDLADRVVAVEDAGMEAAFPQHFGSWVEIALRNGDKRRKDVLDSYGTPANPMPYDAIRKKFSGLVGAAVPGFDQAGAAVLARGISGLGDISVLAAKFSQ